MKNAKKTLFISAYSLFTVFSMTPCFSDSLLNNSVLSEWEYLAEKIGPASLQFIFVSSVILLNLITLFGAMLLFSDGKGSIFTLETLIPTTLYMANPFKLYVYFDAEDLLFSAIIAFLPFLFFFTKKFFVSKKASEKIIFACLFIVIGGLLTSIIVYPKFIENISRFVGLSPTYRPGDYLSSFYYHESRPGLGLGFISVIAAIFIAILSKKDLYPKKEIVIYCASLMFSFTAGMAISGSFILITCIILCIMSKKAVKNLPVSFVISIPAFSFANCIFICNFLSYSSEYFA